MVGLRQGKCLTSSTDSPAPSIFCQICLFSCLHVVCVVSSSATSLSPLICAQIQSGTISSRKPALMWPSQLLGPFCTTVTAPKTSGIFLRYGAYCTRNVNFIFPTINSHLMVGTISFPLLCSQHMTPKRCSINVCLTNGVNFSLPTTS